MIGQLAELRLFHEGPHHVNTLQVVPNEDASVPEHHSRGAPLSPWLQDLLQDPALPHPSLRSWHCTLIC